ncbi:hypothetical protein ACIHIX_38655 [Streptomyces sp. NPDC051913]|uniref:hypothetical protein n=1 Tax=Streptomyces sp. NPDC051913 TaxID=3365676 RepID=UPI0037D2BD84
MTLTAPACTPPGPPSLLDAAFEQLCRMGITRCGMGDTAEPGTAGVIDVSDGTQPAALARTHLAPMLHAPLPSGRTDVNQASLPST